MGAIYMYIACVYKCYIVCTCILMVNMGAIYMYIDVVYAYHMHVYLLCIWVLSTCILMVYMVVIYMYIDCVYGSIYVY